MPSYKLTRQAWLDWETERVGKLLTYILDPHAEYTQAQVLALLADRGLDYSNPEFIDIGSKLVNDAILELV